MLHKTSISLTFLTLCAGAQDTRRSPPQSPEIGYKSAADADQKKTLLLKDFNPTSMLHAAAHKVERGKYYVIDVHNHVNDAQGIADPMPLRRVIEVMDNTNVKTVVILTGMWGEKLQRVLDTMVKPYPGRFIVFSLELHGRNLGHRVAHANSVLELHAHSQNRKEQERWPRRNERIRNSHCSGLKHEF